MDKSNQSDKPKKLKKEATELEDGRKVIYDGDLTVLDKDGELLAWFDAELLEVPEDNDACENEDA
ncbi:MAG: hypothetical protein IKT05_06945 [Fibrobacter sp.]|nr:hypothetical protein [Fibrobacter sp.]